jgi:uncharacterized protein YggU (UPF0235/DUF167 family)
MTVRRLLVRVKPHSRVSSLAQDEDGTWRAHLKAPPVDGKANAELVALAARHFGCPKSAVSIKGGAAARTKLLVIEQPEPSAARKQAAGGHIAS